LSIGSYVAIVFRLSNLHLHHQLLLNPVHAVQLMNLKKRSWNNFSTSEGLLVQTSEQAQCQEAWCTCCLNVCSCCSMAILMRCFSISSEDQLTALNGVPAKDRSFWC
jgi:hypothetical protein